MVQKDIKGEVEREVQREVEREVQREVEREVEGNRPDKMLPSMYTPSPDKTFLAVFFLFFYF